MFLNSFFRQPRINKMIIGKIKPILVVQKRTGAVDIYWFITERFTKFMHQVPEFLQNNVNIKKVKKVIMPITGC